MSVIEERPLYAAAPIKKDEAWKKIKVPVEDYGDYSMIGRLRTLAYSPKHAPKDIFDLLTKLSKGAITLLNELKLNMNPYTNIIKYPTDSFSKSQKVMFNRYMLELKKLKIIKKMVTINKLKPIEKGMYMANPKYFKAVNLYEAEEIWDYLK